LGPGQGGGADVEGYRRSGLGAGPGGRLVWDAGQDSMRAIIEASS